MRSLLYAYTDAILHKQSFEAVCSRSQTNETAPQETSSPIPASPLPSSCHPSQPEYKLARLRWRIQEVRELIHEDLRDLDEPLHTVLDEDRNLSEQHYKVRQTALQARTQIELDIDQALYHLDHLFSGELSDFFSTRVDVMTPCSPASEVFVHPVE